MKHDIYDIYFEDFVFRIQKILKYPWIQMFADWSRTVLVHNRTCCGKYRIKKGFNWSLELSYLWFKQLSTLYSVQYRKVQLWSIEMLINKYESILGKVGRPGLFKGTVAVISSDPPCKDDNARITMVHLKALYNQVWIR